MVCYYRVTCCVHLYPHWQLLLASSSKNYLSLPMLGIFSPQTSSFSQIIEFCGAYSAVHCYLKKLSGYKIVYMCLVCIYHMRNQNYNTILDNFCNLSSGIFFLFGMLKLLYIWGKNNIMSFLSYFLILASLSMLYIS